MSLVFFVSLLLPLMSHSTYRDLHHYCVEQLPAYGYIVIGRVTLKDLIRMCSALDEYHRCITTPRRGKEIPQYRVKAYETWFPKQYDLERASYLYCDYLSQEGLELFKITEKETSHCEYNANLRRCEEDPTWANVEEQLKQDVKQGDTTEVFLRSCRIMSAIVRCQQEIYTTCDPRFQHMFLYYTARLGGLCLQFSGIYNPLIMNRTCVYQASSGAPKRGFGDHRATRILRLAMFMLIYICRPGPAH